MTSEELLSREFVAGHAIEAAQVLEGVAADERVSFLDGIETELAANLVQLIAPANSAQDLQQLDSVRASEILAHVPPDTASILLRRLEDHRRREILLNLPREIRQGIESILRYPENTAGALMEPRVFTLFEDENVNQATAQIGGRPELVLYHIPVIDRQQILKGVVCIRDLMLSEPESSLSEITKGGIARLPAETRREAILQHPGWKLLPDLPVVDAKGRLLGILSYRVLRHLESEVAEQVKGNALSDASRALGELYWLGISAFVRGSSSLIDSDKN